jgi:hypothetical protein
VRALITEIIADVDETAVRELCMNLGDGLG